MILCYSRLKCVFSQFSKSASDPKDKFTTAKGHFFVKPDHPIFTAQLLQWQLEVGVSQ